MPLPKVCPTRSDGNSSFDDLLDYATEAEKTRDRYNGAQCIYVSDALMALDTAPMEMRATASKNPRCEDPVYHFIVSWHANTRPAWEQMLETSKMVLAEAGLSDHEYVVCAHYDKEHHWHVHVVVNRVHPQSYKAWYPDMDYALLDLGARKAEIHFGWPAERGHYWAIEEVNGRRVPVRARPQVVAENEAVKISAAAKQHEVWSGQESFQTWLAGEPAAAVRAALIAQHASWNSVHRALAKFGLGYKPFGSGAVVYSLDDPTDRKRHAKASHMFVGASLRRLEAKLGPFAPFEPNYGDRLAAQTEKIRPTAKPRYERRDIGTSAAYQTMRTAYRGVRDQQWAESKRLRDRAWALQRDSQRERLAALRQTNRQAREAIRERESNPGLRRVLYSVRKMETAQQRERLVRQFRAEQVALRQHLAEQAALYIVQFRDFVEQQAGAGNADAELVLQDLRRRSDRSQDRPGASGIVPPDPETADIQPEGRDLLDLTWRAVETEIQTRSGRTVESLVVEYRWSDGVTAFVDTGDRINMRDESDAAIRAGLVLAREKWGPEIRITGDDEFKRRAGELALEMGMTILNDELADVVKRHQANAARSDRPDHHDGQRPDSSAAEKPKEGPVLYTPEQVAAAQRVDLQKLLESQGYRKVDGDVAFGLRMTRAANVKASKVADEISIKRKANGEWVWTKPDNSSGGGPIHLMQHLGLARNFRTAMEALRSDWSLLSADQVRREMAVAKEEQAHDYTAVRQKWAAATPGKLDGFLATRGITLATLKAYAETVRCDKRGNALFRHLDTLGNVTGYEYKNTGYAGYSTGGNRHLSYLGDPQRQQPYRRIVATETGVDAMSLAQLEGRREDTLYVATSGAPSKDAWAGLRALALRYPDARLVAAFDNDAAGRGYVERMREALPDQVARIDDLVPAGHALRPIKDWNDIVQSRAASVRKGMLLVADVNAQDPSWLRWAAVPAAGKEPVFLHFQRDENGHASAREVEALQIVMETRHGVQLGEDEARRLLRDAEELKRHGIARGGPVEPDFDAEEEYEPSEEEIALAAEETQAHDLIDEEVDTRDPTETQQLELRRERDPTLDMD